MPDQYDQEEDLFRAALRLGTPAERQAYIQDVCRDDPALRSRLSSLLAAHNAEHRVLDVLMPEHDVDIDGAVVAEGPGSVIGRYKLLEGIGEGGMAVVYMAEQQEPIRRKVALKIIKLGMDTKQVIARFEAERQALAMMDHPCIAKVLDAGATETGRPYFVMELVQGIAITDYCDRNRLCTRDRLNLFIQICEAVQHAHQKGIIHRDIKPSNVMVTTRNGVGIPKVIDFGIAKATQQRLTEKTLFTRYAHIIGTPAYMSPEQAELSDLDIDTRSDIYSLGVLLYQLLTGTTPFSEEELRQAGYVGMQRMIREKEPTKPSTKLSTLGQTLTDIAKSHGSSPDLLKRAVRGDLDWIGMKSLEKDRRQRYETANALALDVERHLKNEPVTARPPSVAYRLRKFVRRNTVTVTAVVAVTAVLVLGICLSTWQAFRATQAENVAEKAKALSERQHYAASIALAQNLIEQGQYDRAKQILAQPNLTSSRGWEWGWLERACHRDLMTLTSGQVALTGVDFSPDGRILATGCLDGTASLWDVTTGRKITTLDTGQSFVASVRFSPDGRHLATPNFDGTVKVWDIASRQVLFTLSGHTDWVYSAAFSPDGKRIATASRDRTVRLWDAEDGTLLRTVAEYGDSVICVAFSPDGKKLAYAGGSSDPFVSGLDTTMRVLDLQSGQTQVLKGHSNSVADLAFSSDGAYLVTASWDGTARIADMRSETELRPLFIGPRQSGFWSVAFSPDNRSCALGGGTSQIDARVYRSNLGCPIGSIGADPRGS
jgi:serine/threonine protein kinase/DNA-binding beta-propeller fold protein YncE